MISIEQSYGKMIYGTSAWGYCLLVVVELGVLVVKVVIISGKSMHCVGATDFIQQAMSSPLDV